MIWYQREGSDMDLEKWESVTTCSDDKLDRIEKELEEISDKMENALFAFHTLITLVGIAIVLAVITIIFK